MVKDMINNYDNSSTGVNLELSIFRDCERARMDFTDSFHTIQNEGYRTHTIVSYKWDEELKQFDFADTNQYQFTKKEIVAALIKSAHSTVIDDLNYAARNLFGKTLKQLSKPELVQLLPEWFADKKDMAEWLKDNFTHLFETFETRGYCQGDYAEIIVSKQLKAAMIKETKKTWEQLEQSLQTMFDHLFWDCPVYGRLTVNDHDEIYLDEMLTDIYEYDKDELITSFEKSQKENYPDEQFSVMIEFLKHELPENLEYVG
jgi:hypothetical protein